MQYQEIFRQVFNKDCGDSGNAAMLKELSKTYPYFSPLHFFLLKETHTTDADYKSIAAKAALHVNNPILLTVQLFKASQQQETIITIPEETPATIIVQEEAPETITPETTALETTTPDLTPVPQPDKKEEMLFEPLFASDYFASQGIKLSEEVQSGDKLGKQLKSFTDWLKTMKKVHANAAVDTNISVDVQVQKLAEISNKEEQVITEAMAEVYIQQGKLKKAREVYEKLSLLNPLKSAYFAAKIEFLKDN